MTVSGGAARSSAINGRRSLLAKPLGWSRNSGSAVSRAWLRCSPRRRPGMRVPVAVVAGAVTVCRASGPGDRVVAGTVTLASVGDLGGFVG